MMHSIKKLVKINKIGWFAIQHSKEGWWIGTPKGVTCYKDHDLARVALTMIWQMDGGKELMYSVKPFTGASRRITDHICEIDGAEAMARYCASSGGTPVKGEKGGECNRRVCKTKKAMWFNRSTEKYYCTHCANIIMDFPPNAGILTKEK
jgi:hypothetical protein